MKTPRKRFIIKYQNITNSREQKDRNKRVRNTGKVEKTKKKEKEERWRWNHEKKVGNIQNKDRGEIFRKS